MCSVLEHPVGDKAIDCCIVEMSGRYPESGTATNLVCKELAYRQEGSGEVVIEGESIKLNISDVVLIEPGETFYWNGTMCMVVSCTPAWYLEQHKYKK